jgi:glycosyltransferase involved in cell wall biosynthesis
VIGEHPTRIALDLTITSVNRAGSGVYASRLADAMRPLLGSRLLTLSFAGGRPRGQHPTLVDRVHTLRRDLWWTQYAVLAAAKRGGAGLLHVPLLVGPVHGRLPLILTMHDLAVLRSPEQFTPWFRNYARVLLPVLARRVARIITVSHASRLDILERLDVAEERVVAIHNGVGPEFYPRPTDDEHARRVRLRYGLPDAFVLTVGSIEPRKNLVRLLEAIHSLRETDARLHLVHAGAPGWLATDVPAALDALGLRDRVSFVGYVASEDLPVVYSLARLFVYPSLFEGFGLPVLEAMACGVPVITSSVASLPEVAGDAARLVDPTSVGEIAHAITKVWSDESMRVDLSRRGIERAKLFSWERTARETLSVYEQVLDAEYR